MAGSKVIDAIGDIARKLRNWDERRQDTSDLDTQIEELSGRISPPSASLIENVRQAWEIGQTIDLSGIGYGPVHWSDKDKFRTTPESYYSFLAGFVRHRKCSKILEIGTHFGGSIQAMQRGIAPDLKSKLVTVDITDLNPELAKMNSLTKLTGDANSRVIIEQVLLCFEAESIDLLYIDADHHFDPTIANISIYCMLLRPQFIIMDDIVLDRRMKVLWNVLRISFGGNAINCTDVVPAIRPQSCGFGLLQTQPT